MRKSITLNIPEPCHEDWNEMTPKQQGRHCMVCNKTVVDFTKQTDEQIIKTIEVKGDLCGRFKNQQLNREIVLTRKSKNNYLSWAASGLFAFLSIGNQNTYAQEIPKIVQTDSVKKPQIKGKIATSILNEKVISGTVTSASDRLPLPGVNIIVKGTAKGVITDFDGNYKLKAKKGDILVFNYLGFETIEIKINNSITINTTLSDSDVDILGEVVTTGTFSSRNKWKIKRLAKREAIKNGKQERTLFGRFFFKIKRLFTKKI